MIPGFFSSSELIFFPFHCPRPCVKSGLFPHSSTPSHFDLATHYFSDIQDLKVLRWPPKPSPPSPPALAVSSLPFINPLKPTFPPTSAPFSTPFLLCPYTVRARVECAFYSSSFPMFTRCLFPTSSQFHLRNLINYKIGILFLSLLSEMQLLFIDGCISGHSQEREIGCTFED